MHGTSFSTLRSSTLMCIISTALDVPKRIFAVLYVPVMGLTRCYKTTVFYIYIFNSMVSFGQPTAAGISAKKPKLRKYHILLRVSRFGCRCYYPHMIGKLWNVDNYIVYCFCLFVFTVEDFSTEDKAS